MAIGVEVNGSPFNPGWLTQRFKSIELLIGSRWGRAARGDFTFEYGTALTSVFRYAERARVYGTIEERVIRLNLTRR